MHFSSSKELWYHAVLRRKLSDSVHVRSDLYTKNYNNIKKLANNDSIILRIYIYVFTKIP